MSYARCERFTYTLNNTCALLGLVVGLALIIVIPIVLNGPCVDECNVVSKHKETCFTCDDLLLMGNKLFTFGIVLMFASIMWWIKCTSIARGFFEYINSDSTVNTV